MQTAGIDLYVIFPDDEHGSEYTQPYDKRRDWITGFRGSAGIAVVSSRTAALWTDSRYYTQGEEQLDCANWLLMRDGSPGVPSLINWLVSEANQTILVRFYNHHYFLGEITIYLFSLLATWYYNGIH
jgi:Xaa-Pro aminopeptidase